MIAQTHRLILVSKSPRRQHLLADLGLEFETRIKEVDEVYPPHLKREEVALYLAELKAAAFEEEINEQTIVITADTIVCVDDMIIGKPTDYDDAVRILQLLSGRRHEVVTAVCLQTKKQRHCFSVETHVYFKPLTIEQITYYLNQYKPYDKAGAYGIQEWIGYIGIERIDGSYFNVMGLPVKELYEALTTIMGS